MFIRKFSDYIPHLYKPDYGKTCVSHQIITLELTREGACAGTEWGMYVSFDDKITILS